MAEEKIELLLTYVVLEMAKKIRVQNHFSMENPAPPLEQFIPEAVTELIAWKQVVMKEINSRNS